MPDSVHNARTVLIIDDDEVMRELLSLVLSAEGYGVHTAGSGEDAVTFLEHTAAPQVLLTDLQMPGLSGAALARRLRELSAGSLLVAMSGSEPKEAERAAYDAFLQKPFSAEDFGAALSARPGNAADAGVARAAALNETIFAKLGASMSATQLQQLYAMALEDSLKRVTTMREAAAAGDAATFTREAHAIKGGCGMLGATELHALASRMETGALACTPLLNDFTLAVAQLRRILEAHS